ncbi:MAG: RHS repeat-associated core domain-containing protein [Acidobacteriota bacterium]
MDDPFDPLHNPDPPFERLAVLVTLPGSGGGVHYYKIKTGTMNLNYRGSPNPINPTLPVFNGDSEFTQVGTALFTGGTDAGLEQIDTKAVLTQLILPDNRLLVFKYNEYGEVAEVQLPTGGKVQYDYQGVVLDTIAGKGLPAGNTLGIEAIAPGGGNVRAVDRAVVARRTYADGSSTVEGTWSYDYKIDKTRMRCTSASGTLLDEWHHFLPTQRFLTGSVTTGVDGTGYSLWSTGLERRSEHRDTDGTTVLAAGEQDWSQRASVSWLGFATQQIANDNRVNDERKILNDLSTSRSHMTYDQYNNPTRVDEYDFDGSLKRYTTTSYVTGSPYAGSGVNTRNIVRLPLQQSVFDGVTAVEKARTNYEYDNYTADGNNQALTTYSDFSSIPGHTTSYDTVFTARGNATLVARMVDASTSIASYARYDVLGNVVSAKDPRGNVASIDYLDDFGGGASPGFNTGGHSTYALPTRITSPPPNPGEAQHIAFSQYDYSTGLMTGFKDRNGIIAQTIYNDPFDRPKQIKVALGTPFENHTAMYYAGLNPLTVFGVTLINNDVLTAKDQSGLDDGNLRSWTKTDGFGRTLDSFARDPQGDVRTTASYDGLGRAKRVTNPYRTTSDPTYGYTDTTFDMLGRVTRVETFSGSGVSTGGVTTAYSGAQVTVTDQALKVRRSVTDGLGRLKQVIEDPNVLAYSTTYAYDALDDLTGVTQGVQTRTFAYDRLKRLTQAFNPESGTINYTYDANSNLETKQDARLITTTYAHDALNRVKSRTYTNDPQNTPAVFYKYDAQTLPTGFPAAFNRGFSTGRLVATTHGTSTSSAGNYTGYDPLGRVTSSYQQTESQNYGFGYGYNLAGAMTSETYPSLRQITTSYDAAGRISTSNGQKSGEPNKTYASQFSYAAHGAVKSLQLGNSKWEHTNFNARLQPLQIGLGTSASNSSTLQLDYTYGSTNNNGNVLSQTITIGAGTPTPTTIGQNYGYDALNRLASAAETGAWGQTYDFDRYGNRAIRIGSYMPQPQLTPQSSTPTDFSAFNQITNRIALSGFDYDAAGNLTRDPTTAVANAMIYDGENRQVSYTKAGVTTTYVYDGDGHRVKKLDSTGTIVFVYNAGGQLIAEYHSDPVPPAAGGGGTSYLTTDHLGSTRVVTKQDGTVKSRYDYLPFGEELGATIGQRTAEMGYSAADSTKQKFTQKERDNESGLDYFLARYYSSAQGRFTSSDPLLSSATVYDPQTWNRYSYTLNNPLKYIDPFGLYVWDASLGGSATDEELKKQKDGKAIVGRRDAIRNALAKATEAGTSKSLNEEQRAAVQRAVQSYGTEGQANGVAVGVGKVEGGAVAETSANPVVNSGAFLTSDSAGNVTANVLVTFKAGLTPDANDVAHEGTHVADRQALASAANAGAGDSVFDNPSLNLTRYATESRAYRVSSYVAQSLGLPNYNISGYEIWNSGWSASERQTKMASGINNLLKSSKSYKVAADNPGPKLIEFKKKQ